MRTKSIAAYMAAFCMGFSVAAIADNHEMDEGPGFVPVEIWPCSFVDGKSMDDLNKVIKKWNSFMDEQGDTTYSAWLLTPNFINGNMFDVGWVGMWPNAEAMGAAMERGMAPANRAMTAQFFDVVSCGQHALFASSRLQEPSGETPERAVLRFNDCKIGEGKTGSDAAEAAAAWAQHQHESESQSAAFMWWPAFGEAPAAGYDFKMITANPDYNAFASDFDSYTNGRGFEKWAETIGDTFSCDIGRVYEGTPVRLGEWGE